GAFIGTAMGGAYIIVRDRRNGDVLAEGVAHGEGGDARAIFDKAKQRTPVLGDDKTASFQFSLPVFEPLPVTITARAPLAQEQAQVTTSTDYTLIPGKDYSTGDGIMLQVPGFAVTVTSPAPATTRKHKADEAVELRAHVMKLCACAPDEKGLWPAGRYEVEAHVFRGTTYINSV